MRRIFKLVHKRHAGNTGCCRPSEDFPQQLSPTERKGVEFPMFHMVGAAGFEHATPGSQNQCSTRLSYTPKRYETVRQADTLCRTHPQAILWAKPSFFHQGEFLAGRSFANSMRRHRYWPHSMSREMGFTQNAVALLLRKSFSFDLRQIKRDMR